MKQDKNNEVIIYRQFKGEEEVEVITLERFLELTEERGFYKKGTAMQTMIEAGIIMTDYSFFSLDKIIKQIY